MQLLDVLASKNKFKLILESDQIKGLIFVPNKIWLHRKPKKWLQKEELDWKLKFRTKEELVRKPIDKPISGLKLNKRSQINWQLTEKADLKLKLQLSKPQWMILSVAPKLKHKWLLKKLSGKKRSEDQEYKLNSLQNKLLDKDNKPSEDQESKQIWQHKELQENRQD